MILIAGGSGQLGRQVVRLLTERGLEVRVLTRDPKQSQVPRGKLIDVATGDVRDLHSIERAMDGIGTVVSATHGFTGTGDANPKTVDHLGNQNLIAAARKSGARHFVLLSIHGASAGHPMELFRMKFRAEQELRASGLDWTIVRPTAYMETWVKLIGEPLITTGKTRLFGSGRNPINFVSVYDVARVVERAIVDPSLRGEVMDIGGPENLTARQVVDTFSGITGKSGSIAAVPLPMMRVMSVVMRPLNPMLARQIQAGIVMDTANMSFDAAAAQRRFPEIRFTRLAGMVQRDYGDVPSSSAP